MILWSQCWGRTRRGVESWDLGWDTWVNAVVNFEISNSLKFAGLAEMMHLPLLEDGASALLEDFAEDSPMRKMLAPPPGSTLPFLPGDPTKDNSSYHTFQQPRSLVFTKRSWKLMPTQKFVSDVCRNFVHNCQTWKNPRCPAVVKRLNK